MADADVALTDDRRRTRRSVSILLLGELVARLKGILLIPLLTRYFPAEEYGVVAQASVVIAVVTPIVLLGSESGLARILPGLDDLQRRRSFTAWYLAVLAAAVVVATALVLGHSLVEQLAFGRRGLFSDVVPIIAAGVLSTILVNAGRAWLRIRQQAAALTATTAAQAALNLSAIAIVLLVNGDVVALLAATVASDAALGVALALHLGRRRVWARPFFGGVRPVVRYGLPLLPVGYAVWGMNWFDRVLIVDRSGLSEVGIYALAYSVAYFAVQILANPVWVLFPYSSAHLYDSNQHGPLQTLFRKSFLATLLLVVPFIALTAVSGAELLDLVAPEHYAAGRYVVPLVMAGYLGQMLAGYFETSLGLVHAQWHATIGTFAGLAVNVALNLVLIPTMGIEGAAVATFLGFSTQLLYVSAVAARIGAVREPLTTAAPVLGAGAATAAAAALVHAAVDGAPDLVVLGATASAGLVAYLGALLALRVADGATLRREARTLALAFRRARGAS